MVVMKAKKEEERNALTIVLLEPSRMVMNVLINAQVNSKMMSENALLNVLVNTKNKPVVALNNVQKDII